MGDVLIQTRLPGDLATAVAHIANDEGDSVAAWVRRLVFQEVNLARVKAWAVPLRGLDPKRVFSGPRSNSYVLRPRRTISPLSRTFVLTDRYDEYLRPEILVEQEWFTKPYRYRFVLDRSPTPWRILTIVGDEITLHAEIGSLKK